MWRICSTPATPGRTLKHDAAASTRTSFQFTGEANYLNHPPLFYALLAALGPTLEGRPQALLAHRLIDIAHRGARLCRAARPRARGEFSAPRILRLRGAAGLHSGAGADRRRGQQRQSRLHRRRRRDARGLATRRDRPRRLARRRARSASIAASWAKLTGLLLTGAMLGAVMRLSAVAQRLRWSLIAADRARVRARRRALSLCTPCNMAARRRRRRRRSR